jgi:hypothetical protein
MRRLPGPADCRLSKGDQSPEALFELFSGLAENTNSIFCDGPSRPETTNGCLILPSAGTDTGRHTLRVEHPGSDDLHALPSVPGTPVPPLDR